MKLKYPLAGVVFLQGRNLEGWKSFMHMRLLFQCGVCFLLPSGPSTYTDIKFHSHLFSVACLYFYCELTILHSFTFFGHLGAVKKGIFTCKYTTAIVKALTWSLHTENTWNQGRIDVFLVKVSCWILGQCQDCIKFTVVYNVTVEAVAAIPWKLSLGVLLYLWSSETCWKAALMATGSFLNLMGTPTMLLLISGHLTSISLSKIT